MSDEYAAVRAHRGQYPLRLMCAALEVRVSGFDAAERRRRAAPAPRAVAAERLPRGRGARGAPR